MIIIREQEDMEDNNIKERYIKQNLLPRTISAAILAPVILYLVYKGGYLFNSLITLLALLMGMEWVHIVNSNPLRQYKKLWYLLGIFYIALPCLSLIYLRQLDNGLNIILWLLLTVWASDIGAYVFGIAIGGAKLMPLVSPSKTWSGALGAIIFSCIIGGAYIKFSGLNIPSWLPMCFFLSIVAQIGDLAESGFKRVFKVKDSGALIPGHGGVLDRIDSVVTASVFIAVYYLVNGSL
ncbi:phosphatidate cytidylyltransferase [Holosporaceae bacterium 'Namur']|nr:phosphatidate cytidylyltransferase [Holosporaceae bacterium 'Namur']